MRTSVLLLLAWFGAAHAAPPDPGSAQAALGEGRALAKRGDHSAAIAAFGRALSADPRSCSAASELSLSALALKDLERAERHARDATDFCVSPKQLAGASYNLGLVLSAKGDTRGAVEAFERSLEHNPNHTVDKALAALDAAEAQRFAERLKLRQQFVRQALVLAAIDASYLLFLEETDLDRDGRPERIAYLCLSDLVTVFVEKDAAHRWLLRFEGLRDRPTIGPQQGHCADVKRQPEPRWDRPREPYIRITQSQRDADDDAWWVALRRGSPVVISHTVTNHDTDRQRTKNLDRPPYKSVAEELDGEVSSKLTVTKLDEDAWRQVIARCQALPACQPLAP